MNTCLIFSDILLPTTKTSHTANTVQRSSPSHVVSSFPCLRWKVSMVFSSFFFRHTALNSYAAFSPCNFFHLIALLFIPIFKYHCLMLYFVLYSCSPPTYRSLFHNTEEPFLLSKALCLFLHATLPCISYALHYREKS